MNDLERNDLGQTSPNPTNLMPKLNLEAVAALRHNMLALGAAAEQFRQTLKTAAPGIMANIAHALPKIPVHRGDRRP